MVCICLVCSACSLKKAPSGNQGGEGGVVEDTKAASDDKSVDDTKTDDSGKKQRGVISQAEYPEAVPYPVEDDFFGEDGEFDYNAYNVAYDAWEEDVKSRFGQYTGYKDGFEKFSFETMKQYLKEAGDDNKVYSPINVYIALSMLAEVTDGQSRQQILNLLGAGDIESLRTKIAAMWKANYSDDGSVTSILGNSLWLRDDTKYEQDTMDVLAKDYYASSYKGQMGSDEFNKMLRDWINEQTGGLLKEQAEGIELSADTIMALVSTIYFKASWNDKFEKSLTEQKVFHSPSGDLDCDFMKQSNLGEYYKGDKFGAVKVGIQNSGDMWLVLPDEDCSVDELLENKTVLDTVFDYKDKGEYALINLSVPKFDVVSETNLIDGLKALGVKDVFDPAVSDFTPMTKERNGLSVSQAQHAARVKIDEDGLEAAAYTIIAIGEGAMIIEKEIDFTLDRPFLFVITGRDGMPLFTGVVNQP